MTNPWKIALGIKKYGQKILDDTDKSTENILDYMSIVKKEEIPIIAYLICVKIMSEMEPVERDKVIKAFDKVQWEKMK